jgi:GxxExxY protein
VSEANQTIIIFVYFVVLIFVARSGSSAEPVLWIGGTMGIVYEEQSYAIMGACFEVYREMGCGFTEPIYQECLEIELGIQGIPFRPRRELTLKYKDRPLRKTLEPDFVCFDLIIVEIKAASELIAEHRAQVHNYLKATGLKLGLLVNFGHLPKLEYERIVH